MKLTMQNKTKKYILTILIFLFFITGLYTYKTINDKMDFSKERVIFEYSCRPSINYNVVLKPNELFTDIKMGEGGYYSKQLLDYISADFSVIYQGGESTPLSAKYRVLAKVNGYQGQASNKNIYWSKDFILLEKQINETIGDRLELKEKVEFSLQDYDAFAVKAKEISGMKVANDVVMEIAGTITVLREGKEIDIPFSSGLEVPLLEDVFKIEKVMDEPIQEAVTEKVETILSFNKMKVSLLGAIMILLLTAIPILIFKIKEPEETTIIRRKNSGLLKNYGSRMVAVEEIPKLKYDYHFQVYSIKDLIKISDERQKPIIYIPDEGTMLRNNELFIIDDNNLYSWNSA